MPNWCFTDITFVANGEKGKIALKDLYNKILNQYENGSDFIQNDFGKSWLGNYAILFGLTTPERGDNDDFGGYRARGRLNYIEEFLEDEEEFECFYIQEESAWDPAVSLWQAVINKHYLDENGDPLIEIYYRAEEPGNDLFATNDSTGEYYSEKYHLDFNCELYPNMFPFYTQQPNSPFIKIDQSIKDRLNYYNGGFYPNNKYNTISVPEIAKYEYFEDDKSLIDFSKLIFPEVENIKDVMEQFGNLNNIINDDYDKFGNSFICLNQYDCCSIEDIDPVKSISTRPINKYETPPETFNPDPKKDDNII
jgi:hypothetical protein